jgi:hypothetical protein
MRNCRAAVKDLAVNLPEVNRHAVNVRHGVAEAGNVVPKIVHHVKPNLRIDLVVSKHAIRVLPGMLRRIEIRSRSASPGPHENLDRLLHETKAIPVAVLDRRLWRLSFRTFRPGKKRSAVWRFERRLKSTRAALKTVADATAVGLHVAETEAAGKV